MAEITLSLVGLAAAGTYADTADWAAGFDHAALVAAKRSRADGKDLYVRHLTYGVCETVTVSGANTSSCKVGFNLPTSVSPAPDADYRLVFGDLSRSVPTYFSAGGAAAVTVTASAAPALTLPLNTSYDVTTVESYGVRESSSLVTRRAILHENPLQNLRVQYRQCSGEDAYAVRAVVAGAKGAGAITVNGYSYYIVPGSFEFTQESALHFNVALELELCAL